MIMDPYPSQQHAGLQHEVLQLQHKVTRPKARYKPDVDRRAIRHLVEVCKIGLRVNQPYYHYILNIWALDFVHTWAIFPK